MSVIKSFPDRYASKVATILMLDEEINKMLYYNDKNDVDIYTLPRVKNPITQLKDKKVFLNRRVAETFKESDVSMFINVKNDEPYSRYGKKSLFFDTLTLEVGVICHNACRNTLNGARELIIAERLQEIFRIDERLVEVGKPKIYPTTQSYNIPYEYNSYILTVKVNYFIDRP